MSDLVERLREEARRTAEASRMYTDMTRGPDYDSLSAEQTIAWEAASEIERLEGELRDARELRRAVQDDLNLANTYMAEEQTRPENHAHYKGKANALQAVLWRLDAASILPGKGE